MTKLLLDLLVIVSKVIVVSVIYASRAADWVTRKLKGGG